MTGKVFTIADELALGAARQLQDSATRLRNLAQQATTQRARMLLLEKARLAEVEEVGEAEGVKDKAPAEGA